MSVVWWAGTVALSAHVGHSWPWPKTVVGETWVDENT